MKKRYLFLLVMLASGLMFLASLLMVRHDAYFAKGNYSIEGPPVSGRVVWYTSFPLEQAERIANAFIIEQGIDVDIVRGPALEMGQRIINEQDRGMNNADVITVADIAPYIQLHEHGELALYESPEYEHYPARFKEPGYWAVYAGFAICMAYNKNLTDAPPRRWNDLLDKRWNGRIGLEDISRAGSQYGQYYALRDLLSPRFWESLLGEQAPRVFSSTNDLAVALIEGEIDIAAQFSLYTDVRFRERMESSIETVCPARGVPFIVTPTAIMKSAPNMEQARVFTDFLLSERGQELMQKLAYKYSVRDDAQPLEGKIPLHDLKILWPSSNSDYVNKRKVYTTEFNNFLEAGHGQ